jgi:ankyrin repeat protein
MQPNTPNERLLDAAKKGDTKTLQTLLTLEGANVNACGEERMTALHLAAKNGHIESVQALLLTAKKIDIDARMDEEWTPLYYATFIGRNEVVELLLENGASVDLACD